MSYHQSPPFPPSEVEQHQQPVVTATSASGQAAVWNGQRCWVPTSTDATNTNAAAAVSAPRTESSAPVPPPTIKHNKNHAQLVQHYTEYYEHWTDLSSAASLLKSTTSMNMNAYVQEEADHRKLWADSYAAKSAALAHYHLLLSQGCDPIAFGGISTRPESPPMPPQMEVEIERMETNETTDGSCHHSKYDDIVMADGDATTHDNRKRKEIVEHSNGESLSNATMSKRTKTEEMDLAPHPSATATATATSTSSSTDTLPTRERGISTQASELQNNIHKTSLSQSSSIRRGLNLSSVTTSGQKTQEYVEAETRTVTDHARRHQSDDSLSLTKNIGSGGENGSNTIHQMRNPDVDATRKQLHQEGEDAQNAVVTTKRWTTTLAIFPLLVVSMIMLAIKVFPSTADLPPLLLSLAVIIIHLPIFGILILPFMTTTTTAAAAAAAAATATATPNPINTPTLREFLSHPDGFHMSFAPAFFGFFAYFGSLAALEEETNGRIVPTLSSASSSSTTATITTETTTASSCCGLKSVSGASAGAMAAVMLAAGIQPRLAAKFASTFTWKMIADPPGWGGYVRGNNFEEVMRKFIMEAGTRNKTAKTGDSNNGVNAAAEAMQLEEALIPVAVSAFDVLRMKGMNMTRGCMAKAARCSAGFPGLFQPVAWRGERQTDNKASLLPDSLLIDGGITDNLGLNGLCTYDDTTSTEKTAKRVINMMVGDFGFRGPRGLKTLPPGVNAECLVSIAIIGTPLCGPWAMENGPRAVESARKAMAAILDLPMERGTCDNHYVIRVDASKWLE